MLKIIVAVTGLALYVPYERVSDQGIKEISYRIVLPASGGDADVDPEHVVRIKEPGRFLFWATEGDWDELSESGIEIAISHRGAAPTRPATAMDYLPQLLGETGEPLSSKVRPQCIDATQLDQCTGGADASPLVRALIRIEGSWQVLPLTYLQPQAGGSHYTPSIGAHTTSCSYAPIADMAGSNPRWEDREFADGLLFFTEVNKEAKTLEKEIELSFGGVAQAFKRATGGVCDRVGSPDQSCYVLEIQNAPRGQDSAKHFTALYELLEGAPPATRWHPYCYGGIGSGPQCFGGQGNPSP